MAKFRSEELINELQEDVRQLKAAAEFIQQQDKVKLSYSLEEGRWTVIQIIEHMNMYDRFYLPVIEKELAVKTDERSAWFNSGRLGNYFTKSMKPTNVYDIKNKMKTMKDYEPEGGLSATNALNEYIQQKDKLLQLLDLARDRNLNTIRIPITITRLLKLRLGDTFRFLVAHEQRHMIQARNTLHDLGIATDKFPVIIHSSQLKK
ncbi:MAG: DinB family protein [Flavisolibacter sp.]|nr:DinB family protein [Flavisolibacter sp.]